MRGAHPQWAFAAMARLSAFFCGGGVLRVFPMPGAMHPVFLPDETRSAG